MNTTTEVYVEIDGITLRAGTARFPSTTRGGRQPSSFEYNASYLANSLAYPLDPDLPLSTGLQYRSSGLFGAFGDSAPDRWGRRLIERGLASEVGERRFLSDADYLLSVDDTLRHGAIRFRTAEGPWMTTGSKIPRVIDLPALANRARNVDADPHASVKALLDAGSATLGGARPKATVIDGTSLWVAKFTRIRDLDEWNVIGMEKTALDLAAQVGITVPSRRLVGDTLLLHRFDRDGDRRIGYLSAMSLLGRSDGNAADYLDIALELDGVSAAPDQDLRELWLRAAFSVAVHNTDDHLRNHGFLRNRRGWQLSPLFDVNPNPITDEQRATAIGGANTPMDEFAALIENAAYFRMSRDSAAASLHKIDGIVSGWRSIAASNNVAPKDISLLEDAIELALSALRASM